MTWSYEDPSASEKDEVRFLVGDTEALTPIVLDEEILYALAETRTPLEAAARVARAIAAKYSKTASASLGGDISIQFSQRVEQYRKLADDLEVRARSEAASTVELEVPEALDPDETPMYFSTGMQDNVGTDDAEE